MITFIPQRLPFLFPESRNQTPLVAGSTVGTLVLVTLIIVAVIIFQRRYTCIRRNVLQFLFKILKIISVSACIYLSRRNQNDKETFNLYLNIRIYLFTGLEKTKM